MGEFPVLIPLSVFHLGPVLRWFTKLIKSASLHPSQIVYKNNSILRRLSNTRENFGGNILKQGHYDLPVTESRICYKLREISSLSNTGIIILRMIINSVDMTVFLPQEKAELISKRCKGILSMQEMSIKDLAKLLRTLSSTALAIIPASLHMRYLQRQQIHNLCLKRD